MCGSMYTTRLEAVAETSMYSNAGRVRLWTAGKCFVLIEELFEFRYH